MQVVPRSAARRGDVIEVVGHSVGSAPRIGEIVESIPGEAPHYRVRWEDGREAILFPGDDIVVRRRRRRRTSEGGQS